MSPQTNSSPYGHRAGSGAASIDEVVTSIPVGQVFTEDEIEQEVRRRGLPERGAIPEHLYHLRDLGHVRRADNGWVRLN